MGSFAPRSLVRQWSTVAVVASLGLHARAQLRTLVPITNTAEEHRSAVLSPDGLTVAYYGPNKIAVVPYAGGSEVTLAVGGNLGTFVWAPDSLGIYYLDGVGVNYVQRNAGRPRLVANLPETTQVLCDIKQDGSELLGTWLFVRNMGGQAIRETHVFALATDGMSPPRTLVTNVLTIDGVRVSPDQSKIVYLQYDATPFTPRDYIVANIDGSNPVSLTGDVGLGANPGPPQWRRDGTGIYFQRLDRVVSRPVIDQLSLTSTVPIALTHAMAARTFSVSPDGRWLVYDGFHQPSQSWTLVLVPANGGGHVLLDTSRALVIAGVPGIGGPSNDQVIVSGTLPSASFAQVLKLELVRELRVSPRAEIGNPVTAELPAAIGEAGLVFLTAGRLPGPFRLGGFAGGFELDPSALLTVLTGSGTGGSLTVQIPIPNQLNLRHRVVYMQGVRVASPAPTGDFTRLVELPIF